MAPLHRCMTSTSSGARRAVLVCFLLIQLSSTIADPSVVVVLKKYEVNPSGENDYVDYTGDANKDNVKDARNKLMRNWAGDQTKYTMTKNEWKMFSPPSNLTQRSATTCLRKEYRCLSDKERNAFHVALTAIKNSVVDKQTGSTLLNLCVLNHLSASSPEAHGGPAFLVFHRCFLKK